jgi:hypothetical protein
VEDKKTTAIKMTMQATIALSLSLSIVLVVNRLKKSHKTYTKESN